MKNQRQAKRTRQKFNADHDSRNKARWTIIRAVNMHKMKQRFAFGPGHYPTLIGMNNIERAVFIARQHNLVKPKVLVEAGFNLRRT